MEKLIELLQQIQELAGVAVDALKGAGGGEHGGPPHGAPMHGGGAPEPDADEHGGPSDRDGDESKRY